MTFALGFFLGLLAGIALGTLWMMTVPVKEMWAAAPDAAT